MLMLASMALDKKRIDGLFERQRAHRKVMRLTTSAERIEKLNRLKTAIEETKEDLYQALYEDYRKPKTEADLTEVVISISEINYMVRNLAKFMRPVSVESPISLIGARSELRYEPRGSSLIIAPWNYPMQLSIVPLIGAIAAGNTAILKPSEYTPSTSAYLATLLGNNFPEEEVAVVEGEVDASSYLLEKPFDHIFFTGSPEIGKVVMAAGAKHLAAVTLELGGKCPAIIDESADIRDAARKITWGKYQNCGQTCIAPDYVFVPESKKELFISHVRSTLDDFYGEEKNRDKTPDFARIVSTRHWKRLVGMVESAVKDGAKVEIGGQSIEAENYLAPTVMTNVPVDSKLMQEEIFGPVMPILTYNDIDEVIDFVSDRPNPLALYVFSTQPRVTEKVIQGTAAGGTCVNDVLIHYLNNSLPFGGSGNSGLGNYHGFYSFRAFSHERSVVHQSTMVPVSQMVYPPYGGMREVLTGFLKPFF